jgi:hypothetical protein
MASNSETGHYVNLENYRLLIAQISGLTQYNPVTEKIKILVMNVQWTAGNALHQAYIGLIAATTDPINSREALFDKMTDRVKRSLSLYGSTNAPKNNVKDAKGWADKITGNNVKVKKLEDGTPDQNSISNSQLSFTMRADHFLHLIKIYKNDSNYATNETVLTTASLQALLDEINAANAEIDELIIDAKLKRFERNMSLYLEDKGIIDVALASKKYVRSVYGVSSQEAKMVGAIPFRRFMRLKENEEEPLAP